MNYDHKIFDSPEEFAAYLRSIPAKYDDNAYRNDSWAGDRIEIGIDKLERGTEEYIATAQEIMSKLENSEIFSYEAPILQPSVVGFIPNVPALVAGHPESMFNRGYVESPSVIAPINVYVDTVVSSGVSNHKLIKRGVACAAFVLALEARRPVNLYAVNITSHDGPGGKGCGIYGSIVRVASQPMDLGRATWMLASDTYSRRLRLRCTNFQAGTSQSGSGPWAFNGDPTTKEYAKGMRNLINMGEEDVFIPGGYLFDQLMLTDPVAWVKQMIEKHVKGQE